MKLALAMIVKGTDAEAVVLDRCLNYAEGAVDKIFITITHSPGQERNKAVEKIALLHGAEISDFEWINDFAAARNYNFAQVPKEYTHILWLDADDVLRDKDTSVGMGSNLKKVIKTHPEVDVFSLFYNYAFDEHKNAIVVHQKTRVVKNDGCVSWFGNGIHEDFKENRELSRYAIDGIEIIHLSNESRLLDSRKRNYIIAKEWCEKHPEDPRSYWNLANSALGVAKYDIALKNFDVFMDRSTSDEEKYIARMRRSEVLAAQGYNQKALDEARYAIGLRPEYPDAYHLAGRIFYVMGLYYQAKDMFINGLVRPAPKYKILVYNPRDYDYAPLMMLARTYYQMELPQLALPVMEEAFKIVPSDKELEKTIKKMKKEAKEGEKIVKWCSRLLKIKDKKKLKAELDKVPEKWKYHPEVLRIKNTNFIKETSSGKDLVVFCGYTAEEYTPKLIAEKGSGGSEEALVNLTAGLKKAGWNVTVYNNCGDKESVHDGVIYRPYMSYNYRDKQDVTIIWRMTRPLDWGINSDKIFLDLHDVMGQGEFTAERLKKLNKIFFKSQYHRNLYPNVPDDKCIVIPNGIHTEQFVPRDRDNKLMINTASPVRALSALIDIMKEVRKEVPDAKMQWAYGWTVTDKGMADNAEYPIWKENILKGMKEAGIEDLGRLTFEQVAELNNKASMYIYPTGFPEIDCISITKALAAGCYPVTTDYGAIKEKSSYGGCFINYPDSHEVPGQIDFSVNSEEVKQRFVKQIVDKLKNPPTEEERRSMTRVKEKYSWDSIVEQWLKEING